MKALYTHKRKVLLAVAVVLTLLSGCKSEIPIVNEIKETKAYTLAQSNMILSSERNQYQQIYTYQIWGTSLPDGQTFETYMIAQVKEFLEEMKMMNLLAENKGITLTSPEKEEVNNATDAYFDSLSEAEVSYLGVTREDVHTMYHDYYMSNKVVKELTKNMDLEISDSEAKVIQVQQIVMSDRAAAEKVRIKAQDKGADFPVIARGFSENEVIDRKIGRGEHPGACEDAAFSLVAGQVSKVIEEDGKYYIFKCVNDYDEEATQDRKAGLYLKRKREVFGQIYNQFKKENPVTFSGEIWKDVKFSKEDTTIQADFFKIYRNNFPGN
jgi:foldase protein PrsA